VEALLKYVLPFMGGVFLAGGFFFGVKQQRKDLNGAMGRVRKMDRNFLLTLMVILDDREDREFVAKLFRE